MIRYFKEIYLCFTNPWDQNVFIFVEQIIDKIWSFILNPFSEDPPMNGGGMGNDLRARLGPPVHQPR